MPHIYTIDILLDKKNQLLLKIRNIYKASHFSCLMEYGKRSKWGIDALNKTARGK